MTSTFDNLEMLFYLVKEHPEFRELVTTIYDYAISEINKVNPKILHWGSWIEKHGLSFYIKLYGNEIPDLYQKSQFLSDAHSDLDHTSQYHFKCVHNYLDIIIGGITDWFYKQPHQNKDGLFNFYRVSDFNKRVRDRYPKVFILLKPILLTIMDEDDYNLRYIKRWK